MISNYRPQSDHMAKNESLWRPPFGAISVCRTQGDATLLDHPVREQNYVRMEVLDADLYSPRDHDLEAKIRIGGGRQLVDIAMSDSQYVRMIRGEFMEVPCTINRSFGYSHDEPNNDFMEPVKLRQDVEQRTREMIDTIRDDLDNLYEALSEGKLTSKKKIEALINLVEEIEQQWAPIFGDLKAFRSDSISQVRNVFIQRLADQVKQDVKRMPKPDQALLMDMLKDI